MKAHLGVDSRTKLIHSVAATAANVHDSQVLPELLHVQETRGGAMPPNSRQREVIRPMRHGPIASCRPKPIAIGRSVGSEPHQTRKSVPKANMRTW
jgi:hypothetical protein